MNYSYNTYGMILPYHIQSIVKPRAGSNNAVV